MSEHFRTYIKREPPTHLGIKFRCAKLHKVLDPSTGEASFHYNSIYDVFKARGWKETDVEKNGNNEDKYERHYKHDWHIFWADKDWIHYEYDKIHLEAHQRVNHFRNHYELTRKDLLVKNIKRQRRQLEKEGKFEEVVMNICPMTFVLPQEYSMFVDEFKKGGSEIELSNGQKKKDSNTWIMKPIGRSQGLGIFLVNKLNQIQQWRPVHAYDSHYGSENKPDDDSPEQYVVQRYIENPMLIGGKKFDLRLFVLVTSYIPLTAYMYREGFCRFSMTRFSMDNIRDTKNVSAHLTNVAVQKRTLHAKSAYMRTGAKWSLHRFKQYLLGTTGAQRVNAMFLDIENLIIQSLLSVQKVMINDKHCFELYGYDILLDSNMKASLIEVNASPSLTANTQSDYDMKFGMLDDVLTIIDVEKYLDGTETRIGGFDVICRDGKRPDYDDSTVFSSHLGMMNDRKEQLNMLAKERAQKLHQPSRQVQKSVETTKGKK